MGFFGGGLGSTIFEESVMGSARDVFPNAKRRGISKCQKIQAHLITSEAFWSFSRPCRFLLSMGG